MRSVEYLRVVFWLFSALPIDHTETCQDTCFLSAVLFIKRLLISCLHLKAWPRVSVGSQTPRGPTPVYLAFRQSLRPIQADFSHFLLCLTPFLLRAQLPLIWLLYSQWLFFLPPKIIPTSWLQMPPSQDCQIS